MRRRLAGFELLREDEVLVAGRAGVDVGVRYRDDEDHLYQRTISMIIGARFVTVGVVSPVTLSALADDLFEKVRGSMSVREGEGRA
jgi:hypothetical protein